LVAYDFTPSFIYPIRLIVEAKAYLPTSHNNKGKVGISVVRNAVGVLKDVNENFFSYNQDTYKFKRFNYTYAIFSLCRFTEDAQRYAIAHQIFLIQYYFNPLFEGIKKLILEINSEDLFAKQDIELKKLRKVVRAYLQDKNGGNMKEIEELFSPKGQQILKELKEELDKIGGSYFGLLNGEYPIHLISEKPLTKISKDEISAKVRVHDAKYVSLEFHNDDSEPCKLFFELPEAIVEIFSEIWGDKRKIAETKRKHINYITLTGIIDGIRRNIMIKLDEEWLNNYLMKIRMKHKAKHHSINNYSKPH